MVRVDQELLLVGTVPSAHQRLHKEKEAIRRIERTDRPAIAKHVSDQDIHQRNGTETLTIENRRKTEQLNESRQRMVGQRTRKLRSHLYRKLKKIQKSV